SAFTIELGGRSYEVSLGEGRATIDGREVEYAIRESSARGAGEGGATATAEKPAAPTGAGELVRAELAGQVLRIEVKEGDRVAEGDLLLVLEALKMEIEVRAPLAGRVRSVLVAASQSIASGDGLVEIAP
ncbi:MAG: biotin/lipoyl-binding protein, partial [Myxococcales bacterium]|nr:biotin/lipoyl-binding protein [Myxococcales bacterium]